MEWSLKSLGIAFLCLLTPVIVRAAESDEDPVYPRFTGRESANFTQLLDSFRLPDAGLPQRAAVSDVAATPSDLRFALTSPPLSPGFELRPMLPAGLIPTDVAVADFNGDGHLDFAVTSGWEDSLSITFGRGDGTFELPRVRKLKGRSPLSVEAVDLQGDGASDLVVCYGDSASVGVLHGLGDGTFAQEDAYPVYARCIDTITRDFNGDGILDILVVYLNPHSMAQLPHTFNVANGLALLPGRGEGRFGPLQFQPDSDYYGPIQSSVADLNGNGRLDVVSASMSGGVAVFLNDGGGNFNKGAHLAASWGFNPITGVQLMDVDRDGCFDAVIIFFLGHTLPFFGRCDGTFRQGELWNIAGHRVYSSAVADMDGDGILDLILVGTRASVLRGDGRGGFKRARTIWTEPGIISVGIGDFNEDGRLDLIPAHQNVHAVTYMENEGNGRFGLPGGAVTMEPHPSHQLNPSEPIVADLNRDGQNDLLFLEPGPPGGPNQIGVILGSPDDRFENIVRSETNSEHQLGFFALADFRNTGHLDLVVIGGFEDASNSIQYISFSPGLGDGRFGPVNHFRPAKGGGGLLAIADFNLDGYLDIATAGQVGLPEDFGQRVAIFLGNGDGTFREEIVTEFGFGLLWPAVFQPGDFNRDGIPDLLVWAYANGPPNAGYPLYQLLGKGDGTFHPARQLFENFRPFSVLDLNGDGIADLLTSKDFSSDYPVPTRCEFEVFLGSGDGNFHRTEVYRPFEGVNFIPYFFDTSTGHGTALFNPRIGDFNGDGAPDILAFQYDPETYQRQFVQLLVGNGDGTFTISNLRYDIEGMAVVGDLDGDGFSDLIGINLGLIEVIRGRPGPSFQFELVNPRVEGIRGFGRLRLAFPAVSPVEFHLSSSSPHIRPPHSVVIPAGQSEAVFAYSIESTHDWRDYFSLTVARGGEKAVAHGWQKAPTVLFVPHLGDGTDGAIRLKTSFLLVNTGDHARALIEFFDPASEPLAIHLRDRGTSSSFKAAFPMGHSISLESAGDGPLRTGYARVSVFGRIDGTAVFSGIDVRTGLLMYEAGVPMTPSLVEATILLDSTGSRDTGLAVVNTAAKDLEATLYQGDALARMRLYDRENRLVDEMDLGLLEGEYRARFISEFFESSPEARDMIGSLTIASELPLALMTLRLNHDSKKPFPLSVPTLTAFPVVPSRAERLTNVNPFFPLFRYLAEFGDGEYANVRFQTTLLLTNTGIDSDVTIHFFDSEGLPMEVALEGLGTSSKFELSLKRGASAHLRSSGKGPLRVGHARINALPKVAGTAVFTGFDPATDTPMYEAGVPLTTPLNAFTVFVDSLGDKDTGIAIANPRDASWPFWKDATVRLRLYNTRFELLGERTLIMPAGKHIARYIRELFPKVYEASEMQGILTVISDEPLIAVTLRSNDNPELEFPSEVPSLTTFPVISGSADTSQ